MNDDEEDIEVAASPNLLENLSPEEIRKLHANCMSKFTSAAEKRRAFESQWYMNLAFYMGKQYVVDSSAKSKINSGSGLYEPPAPRWGVRIVANKIQPTVRNELTKLTKEEFQSFVVPNTTEEADLAAARAGEAIIEYLFNDLQLNRIRSAASLWACITGVGYIKTMYEPNEVDSSGIQGKVNADAINPFHIYAADLNLDTVDKQPYMFHAMTMDSEDVEAMFGVETENDSRSEESAGLTKIHNLLNTTNEKNNKVYVREMWIKPCSKYPDGAVIWFTKDKILQAVPWFYEHKQYPFIKIDHIPVPGRFYADSVVTQMIALQKEYNKVRSQLLENKNRTSRPQFLAPKGSVDARKITSEPGLVIEYTPGFAPPTALQPPQIPSYVLQEQDRILKDMDDVSGQYEITKGRTPPGVEAASAIAYLQEENDSRMHHTITSVEYAIARLGRQLLSIVGTFWEEERIIRVISGNNTYEAKKFKGSDLRGNLDFRVEAGSMAPRSKAAKQAFITELMKMGAIPPQAGLKYLQMSETNRLYQDLQQDNRHAERENDKLKAFVPPILNPLDPMASEQESPPTVTINDWDNDQVHIEVHESLLKSQEFELLSPEAKSAIVMHRQMHVDRVKQRAMEQMMAQTEGAPIG